MREPVSSPFTSFLAQHFDQINDYLATFFDGQATSADIERYLYAPLSAFTANAGKWAVALRAPAAPRQLSSISSQAR